MLRPSKVNSLFIVTLNYFETCMRERGHYSLFIIKFELPNTFLWEGGHILYSNDCKFITDFLIEKNFCQRQDKFVYGFHGNNHKPPHQDSLLSFKNLMREVTISREFSMHGHKVYSCM